MAAYKAGRSESIFISGQADVWRNHVFEVNSGIEMFWNLSYVLVLLVFTYRIIVWMKKYLEMKENYENSQLIFVLFPSVTGLLLCLMIRSMMFSMEDNDIHSLFDSRPEMNLMVPCTSLLCIVMIILPQNAAQTNR